MRNSPWLSHSAGAAASRAFPRGRRVPPADPTAGLLFPDCPRLRIVPTSASITEGKSDTARLSPPNRQGFLNCPHRGRFTPLSGCLPLREAVGYQRDNDYGAVALPPPSTPRPDRANIPTTEARTGTGAAAHGRSRSVPTLPKRPWRVGFVPEGQSNLVVLPSYSQPAGGTVVPSSTPGR